VVVGSLASALELGGRCRCRVFRLRCERSGSKFGSCLSGGRAVSSSDGEWKDGLRSGFGTFNYADGAYFKGKWADNFKQGAGTYISGQGAKTTGIFDKGHLIAPGGAGEQFVGPNSIGGKAAGGMGDGDVQLQIADLVGWAANGERQVSRVKKVLLGYISELKVIFQAYSKSDLFPDPDYKDQASSVPGPSTVHDNLTLLLHPSIPACNATTLQREGSESVSSLISAVFNSNALAREQGNHRILSVLHAVARGSGCHVIGQHKR
jgi:hypothetical protein